MTARQHQDQSSNYQSENVNVNQNVKNDQDSSIFDTPTINKVKSADRLPEDSTDQAYFVKRNKRVMNSIMSLERIQKPRNHGLGQTHSNNLSYRNPMTDFSDNKRPTMQSPRNIDILRYKIVNAKCVKMTKKIKKEKKAVNKKIRKVDRNINKLIHYIKSKESEREERMKERIKQLKEIELKVSILHYCIQVNFSFSLVIKHETAF